VPDDCAAPDPNASFAHVAARDTCAGKRNAGFANRNLGFSANGDLHAIADADTHAHAYVDVNYFHASSNVEQRATASHAN
jgi:hypothetical protein